MRIVQRHSGHIPNGVCLAGADIDCLGRAFGNRSDGTLCASGMGPWGRGSNRLIVALWDWWCLCHLHSPSRDRQWILRAHTPRHAQQMKNSPLWKGKQAQVEEAGILYKWRQKCMYMRAQISSQTQRNEDGSTMRQVHKPSSASSRSPATSHKALTERLRVESVGTTRGGGWLESVPWVVGSSHPRYLVEVAIWYVEGSGEHGVRGEVLVILERSVKGTEKNGTRSSHKGSFIRNYLQLLCGIGTWQAGNRFSWDLETQLIATGNNIIEKRSKKTYNTHTHRK